MSCLPGRLLNTTWTRLSSILSTMASLSFPDNGRGCLWSQPAAHCFTWLKNWALIQFSLQVIFSGFPASQGIRDFSIGLLPFARGTISVSLSNTPSPHSMLLHCKLWIESLDTQRAFEFLKSGCTIKTRIYDWKIRNYKFSVFSFVFNFFLPEICSSLSYLA